MPLILTAAVAAALGRFLLALAFRLLGGRLPAKYRRNLKAARAALEKNKRNAIIALGLFALSPVPSAQLFEAAGLAGVRLLPFTLAFFLGRTVSYWIYVFTAAGLRATSLGDTFREAITSPWASPSRWPCSSPSSPSRESTGPKDWGAADPYSAGHERGQSRDCPRRPAHSARGGSRQRNAVPVRKVGGVLQLAGWILQILRAGGPDIGREHQAVRTATAVHHLEAQRVKAGAGECVG